LVIGFIEHFQIVAASNHSAIANTHTQQFTTACNKSSQFVSTSRFPATDPNYVLCLRPDWPDNISQLTKIRVMATL
jgi:hypothetical protein